jgi:signal transduction histidine kinase
MQRDVVIDAYVSICDGLRDLLNSVGLETRTLGSAAEAGPATSPYAEETSTSPSTFPARWTGDIGLAVLAGLAYFLTARLSLGLLTKPDGVAVFWPAAGISSGLLIALGRAARWPILIGVMVAIVAANLMGDRNIWASCAFAVCNAVEATIVSGLVQHYFGTGFALDRLRQVLGLATAAVAGTAIAGVLAAVAYALFHAPKAPMLTTWTHWFTSDCIGAISVAPLVIGLFVAVREKPPRRELIEGAVALAMLTLTTIFIVSLPRTTWEIWEPEALLLPMLFWLAVRCRPVFSAAGAFLVSFTIVCTAIFGFGHFGDPSLALQSRMTASQTMTLFVTLGALALAALFAERRESESRLARSKFLLERERDNKLMSVEALVAAISHELRQPLTGITTRIAAARRFLQRTPLDIDRVRDILDEVAGASFRASEVIDSFRALFRKSGSEQVPIDANTLVIESLEALRRELNDHRVITRTYLAPDLPIITGYKGLLQEVILNLVQNAIDALETVTDRSRLLRVETTRQGADAIVISIEDNGPGIDHKRIADIFDPFVTTKAKGTGLGLAISRMVVEHHSGQLTVSSDGKTGARFWLMLPIADDAAAST